MLVLTRKADETIHIGNDITITLLRVRGNQVRIGIDAPMDISIRRGEIDVKAAAPKLSDGQRAVSRPAAVGRRSPLASFCTAP